MTRVLHLVGSAVSEFHADLSRLYAADCLRELSGLPGHSHVVAYVSPDRRWRFPAGLDRDSITAAPSLTVVDALAHIDGLGIDVVVPQMFCVPGMTHYRGLFDVLGLPYVGNPPAVMALAADKSRARAVVAAAGVAVPAGERLGRGQAPTLRPPVVVKPVDADNSDGVSLVRHESGYDTALASALLHSDHALVERYVELGREVRCGVLERDGRLVALPLEEYAVDPVTTPVRTGADKLARTGTGELRLVAKDAAHAWLVDLDDPVTTRVHEAAAACHEAMGCRDYSLFDFRIDPDGRPWFLEASLYSSFARTSVLSVMAGAVGIGIPELFTDLARAAVARTAPGRPAPPQEEHPWTSSPPARSAPA